MNKTKIDNGIVVTMWVRLPLAEFFFSFISSSHDFYTLIKYDECFKIQMNVHCKHLYIENHSKLAYASAAMKFRCPPQLICCTATHIVTKQLLSWAAHWERWSTPDRWVAMVVLPPYDMMTCSSTSSQHEETENWWRACRSTENFEKGCNSDTLWLQQKSHVFLQSTPRS